MNAGEQGLHHASIASDARAIEYRRKCGDATWPSLTRAELISSYWLDTGS